MARTGYYLVDVSPWPISASISGLGFTSGFVIYMHEGMCGWSGFILLSSFFLLVLTACRWWGDLVLESTFLGHHTSLVVLNLKYGFWLFVLSEAFLFFSFFWAFFNSGIGELSQQTVGQWPPLGVKSISPWGVPLLNTAVLIGSGLFVNWAHEAVKCHSLVMHDSDMDYFKKGSSHKDDSGFYMKIMNMKKSKANKSASLYWWKIGLINLGITILLGIFFTGLQFSEYYMASFTIADSVYGSCFYILTGFHGGHVIAGTIFLTVCWFRLYFFHFSYQMHHFGLYAATMYWHFVDLVWVVVYCIVYIWGH